MLFIWFRGALGMLLRMSVISSDMEIEMEIE